MRQMCYVTKLPFKPFESAIYTFDYYLHILFIDQDLAKSKKDYLYLPFTSTVYHLHLQ